MCTQHKTMNHRASFAGVADNVVIVYKIVCHIILLLSLHIYIYIHTLSLSIYIYIYMYICIHHIH